ncbi:hypothetical protein [Rhodospira trueperi]|uniref:hypothetical protein n=1 Tax=Rhodospira trueperi TaxID=69960 RepID=UPI00115F8226|nr:hypothetical protein [Rhodospira trueperi]
MGRNVVFIEQNPDYEKNNLAIMPKLFYFSFVGAELFKVVSKELDRDYALMLRDGLATYGLTLSFPDVTPPLDSAE